MALVVKPREKEFHDKIAALVREYYDVAGPQTCEHVAADEVAYDDCLRTGDTTAIPNQYLMEWILLVNFSGFEDPDSSFYAALCPPMHYTHKIGLITACLEDG